MERVPPVLADLIQELKGTRPILQIQLDDNKIIIHQLDRIITIIIHHEMNNTLYYSYFVEFINHFNK